MGVPFGLDVVVEWKHEALETLAGRDGFACGLQALGKEPMGWCERNDREVERAAELLEAEVLDRLRREFCRRLLFLDLLDTLLLVASLLAFSYITNLK